MEKGKGAELHVSMQVQPTLRQ